MNLIRKEVITSLPVSLAYLFSITAAYAQTVQAFTLQNLVWSEKSLGKNTTALLVGVEKDRTATFSSG